VHIIVNKAHDVTLIYALFTMPLTFITKQEWTIAYCITWSNWALLLEMQENVKPFYDGVLS
jgi:hypothetical protein